jgi:stringent starvation protein B
VTSKSNRPYLVRAIWEWCSDNGYTPYLAVQVDENTRVPLEYVRNGEIVLNLSPDATHRLSLGDDTIQFSARFSGVSRECYVPMTAVRGIFARENGEGLFFQPQSTEVQLVGAAGPEVEGESGSQAVEPAPASSPATPPTAPPDGGAPAPARKSHLQIVK